jgi:hypothetical protein
MLIANPKQSTPGLPNLDPRVLIPKLLVGAAIVFGCCLAGAATASADPNSSETQPDPFGSLTCSCQQTAPASGPVLREEIDRGIRDGLAAPLS